MNAVEPLSTREHPHDTSFDLLCDWLRLHGISWHPDLVIRRSLRKAEEEHDYACESIGLHLQDDIRCSIKAGSIVASIPLTAILSKRTSSFSTSLNLNLPDHHALAAHLLHEQLIGDNSRWKGYLASLPSEKELNLPRGWTADARIWLRGTELERLLLREDGEAARAWEQAVLPALETERGRYSIEPTFAAYEHALALVSSRAFGVDAYHGLSMVPLADIFNHSADPHVSLQSDYHVCSECGSLYSCVHDEGEERVEAGSELPAVEMVALRAIDKESGGEVFNTYTDGKPTTNAVLLHRYGFALEGNPADILLFPLLALKSFRLPVPSPLQHLASTTMSSEAYIDADALISPALWTATGSVKRVRAILAERRASMHDPESSIEELLELKESANDRSIRLAIGHAVDERLLLTACDEGWREVEERETDL